MKPALAGFFVMENLFDLFYQTSGVSTDTRKIEKDNLFIALSGPNFNGNKFAKEAIEKGAKFAVVDDKNFADNETIFYTNNTLEFLQDLARYHRRKFNIPLLGITGSNGKTTSKELINSVLSSHFKTLCTVGNLNNHIGVPLTLLKLNEEHEIAIIEMGANKLKDIEELCHIAEPNFGYITNIGKAHLEGFINLEGVVKTKSELIDSIVLNTGTFFVNRNDDVIFNAALERGVKIISYGSTNSDMVNGKIEALNPLLSFSYQTKDYHSPSLKTNLVGSYNLNNLLAAVTIGIHYKVPYDKINSALENYVPSNNRSQITKTNRNTLIVDCYNANPSSMRAALENFNQIQHENKFVIIGDMLELGIDSESEHQNILDFCKDNEIKFYTVGKIFKNLNPKGFLNTDEIKSDRVLDELSNAFILLKGSRGIALEKLIELL